MQKQNSNTIPNQSKDFKIIHFAISDSSIRVTVLDTAIAELKTFQAKNLYNSQQDGLLDIIIDDEVLTFNSYEEFCKQLELNSGKLRVIVHQKKRIFLKDGMYFIRRQDPVDIRSIKQDD